MPERVELDGGRAATYAVVGEGEPMLWFEGGPGLPAHLSIPDVEPLADRFRVYLIDPHGSGGSTAPATPDLYDHLGHARFYDEVRQALGLGALTVAGISFGGTVALTYAALFPDTVTRCIAVDAFALGSELEDAAGAAEEMELMLARHADAPWFPAAHGAWSSWTERTLAAEKPAEVEEMMRAALPLYFAYPDRPDVRRHIERWGRDLRMDLAAAKAWESGLYQHTDVRPLLGRVRCPTLVVAGELDLIGGPAQARAIADAVPGSTLALVPEAGHFPAYENPDGFRRAILDWVDASG